MKTYKPTWWEIFCWGIRSKGNFLYDSALNARIYDYIARVWFGREKMGQVIAGIFRQQLNALPSRAFICERAAGTGVITEALDSAGFLVRASDLSKFQLDEISKKLPGVNVVCENLNNAMIGVDDFSAHGVLQVGADRFITAKGQELYVNEARRVLKKDGLLIWPIFPGEFIFGKLFHGRRWRGSSAAIIHLLRSNGFEIVSQRRYVFAWNAAAICRIIVAKKL